MKDEWLTVREAADMFKVTTKNIYLHVKKGHLKTRQETEKVQQRDLMKVNVVELRKVVKNG